MITSHLYIFCYHHSLWQRRWRLRGGGAKRYAPNFHTEYKVKQQPTGSRRKGTSLCPSIWQGLLAPSKCETGDFWATASRQPSMWHDGAPQHWHHPGPPLPRSKSEMEELSWPPQPSLFDTPTRRWDRGAFLAALAALATRFRLTLPSLTRNMRRRGFLATTWDHHGLLPIPRSKHKTGF